MKIHESTFQFTLGFMLALCRDLQLPTKDITTLERRAVREGVSFFSKTLPLLGKALDKGLSGTNLFKLPSNFKRRRKGSQIPAFCGSLFQRIFSKEGRLLDDPCVVAIDALRQLLFTCYKLDLPYENEEEERVVEAFVQAERDLISVNQDIANREDPILEAASLVISEIFKDFSADDIVPRHGPGVTSNVDISDKYEHRLNPLPVTSKFGSHFFFNPEDGMTRLDRYPVRTTFDYFRGSDVAKVILVPKDSRGPRLISCEPCENQWIQQGIMDFLVRKIENHPLTRGQVNFSDQSVNQRLVLEHSRTRKYSTLDLKEASDRNSLSLFARLFGRSGDLFQSILSCRSRRTELPSGQIINLQKFAPMGSALCFPVMALTIYLLVYLHLVRIGISPKEARTLIFVYGDDIVIDTAYAEYCVRILEQYGFKVNDGKSFINSPFLESCGVDAFDGTYVTPIRLRSSPYDMVNGTPVPEGIVSSLATANLLVDKKQCLQAAEYIYRHVECVLGPLPYGHAECGYLHRFCRTDDIPERNYLRLELGGSWRRKQNLQRYPLGCQLRVWRVRSRREHVRTTPYGHLSRTHMQWGKHESVVPRMGEFDVRRSVFLMRTYVDHYSMKISE